MKIRLSNLSCILYYVALAIVIVANILFVESTLINFFSIDKGVWLGLCENVCWSLLFFRSVFLEKYSKKEVLIIAFLLSLSGISMIMSGGSHLLLNSIVFLISSKNVNFSKIVKVALLSNILGVGIILIMALTGLIEANAVSRVYDGTRVVMRFSLGFSQPNYLGSHLFIICLCIAFIYFKRMSFKTISVIVILDVFIYMTCYSRTNCILVISILIVSVVANKVDTIQLNGYSVIKKILTILPIAIFIAIVICSIFYSDFWLGTINKLMSNRLLYSHEYFNNYGFSILGQPVDFSEITTRAYTIDCAYIYLAIRFGVIWAFLFPCVYTQICKRAIQINRLDIVVLVVTVALWGISETYYFRIQYNFSLILMGIFLFTNGNQLLEGENDNSNEVIV